MESLNASSPLEEYQQKLLKFFNDFSNLRGSLIENYNQKLEKFFNELSFRYRIAKEVKEYTDRFLASDFNLVGIFSPDEVRISGILVELLNPKGKHGQRELFLKEFIETLKGLVSNSETLGGVENLTSAKISTEYSTPYGRIDILIEFPNSVAIAIENKPWAGEQSEQLQRYIKWLEKTYEGRYLLVFLTGTKRKATSIGKRLKNQLKEEGKFLEASYGELLKPWLLKCAKECESDKVRWFLKDFVSWIDENFKEV